jgi:hypothetical protein
MTDPNEMFSIVLGPRPEALVIGPKSEVMEYIGGSVARNEKEAKLAQAERDAKETERFHDEVMAHAAQILTDGMARLNERIDQYEARRQARADQQKRDAEAAEIARIEAMINALPDPDDPTALGDDGDLKATKPPPDTEKYDPENPDLWDPEDVEDAVTGAMPKELDKGAPPEAGEYSATLPPAPKYRDPPSTGGP